MSSRTLINRERDAGRRRIRCAPARAEATGTGVLWGREPESAATLEDLVLESWAGLRSDATVACPWCDGAMEPRWSAGAGVVGGRCGRCNAQLA